MTHANSNTDPRHSTCSAQCSADGGPSGAAVDGSLDGQPCGGVGNVEISEEFSAQGKGVSAPHLKSESLRFGIQCLRVRNTIRSTPLVEGREHK